MTSDYKGLFSHASGVHIEPEEAASTLQLNVLFAILENLYQGVGRDCRFDVVVTRRFQFSDVRFLPTLVAHSYADTLVFLPSFSSKEEPVAKFDARRPRIATYTANRCRPQAPRLLAFDCAL